MKKVMTVSVMDQRLTVRSESDEEALARVTEFVNRKIKEVTSQTRHSSPLTAALLACMNIANEYLHLRETQAQASQRVRDLIASFEGAS